MGLLDLMIGGPTEGDGATMQNSYVLAKETHGYVYPVAARRSELEALAEAIDALETAPPLAENKAEVQEVFDGLGADGIDVAELVERTDRQRKAIEPVVETWLEALPDEHDIGVVYVPPGFDDQLRAIVKHCTQRDDDEHDAFELPEGFGGVVALFKRIDDATDGQYRAVVHDDLVPSQR